MDTLGTDNPNFMERLWFMAYTDDGKLQMMAGLGSHTNKGLTDAFLLIRYEGMQRNIRLSRHLKADRSYPVIGPLGFEIIESLQHWRIRLDANEELGCALDVTARTAPFLFHSGSACRATRSVQRTLDCSRSISVATTL
jgi:hypothetical protein